MVRGLVVLFLALAAFAGQAAQLAARLDRQTTRLGEAVTLHLELRGPGASLADVDLAALGADFEVFNVTRSGTEHGAQLEATLYPRASGVLQVPAFTVGGARSRPLTLTVSDDPDLTVDVRFVPDSLFERQGSTLTVTLRDRADRPWTTAAALQAPGLLLRPLGERQFEEGGGPERVTVRELRWAVLALKADHHVLRLPMLETHQLGRRLRMPLPAAALDVRALPTYLPVAVPVGRPQLAMAPLPATAQVGQAMLWVWWVAAPGFSADAARALLVLPRGEREGLRFYPAGFREETSQEGVPRLRVEVPLQATRSGVARLPALSLPYFDPATQRVEALVLPAARIDIVDPLWRRLAGVAAVIALLVSLGFALYHGRRRWERHRARRAALERIARASTPAELAQAVRSHSLPPAPPTLRRWLARQPPAAGLDALVEALEGARFGPAPMADLAACRRRWIAALKRLPLT